ncbi:MAG: hypothetical protein Fur0042_03240 [Cyanophyceae cyanobacterium]
MVTNPGRASGPARPVVWVIAIAIGLSLVFRFGNLASKPYWGDEVFSSFRVAGYTLVQVRAALADGQPRSPQDLQAFQVPQEVRGPADTIRALAIDDPQHPPLYFLMARQWQEWFGNSVAVRRLLPALLGVLLIPAAAAIAGELWRSRGAAWVAAGLVATSPLHVLYGQEVRQYSLWTVAIALTGWALLRAWRRDRGGDWVLYGVLTAALLYLHLFSLLIVAGYVTLGLLLWWRDRRGPIQPFAIATGAALLTFSPWLWAVAQGTDTISQTNGWTADSLPLPLLVWNWGLNLARLWVDFDGTGELIPGTGPAIAALRGIAIAGCGAAVAASAVVLGRSRDRRPLMFLGMWLAAAVVPLILADLLFGGCRSAIARYPIAGYLAVQIAIAGWLGLGLERPKSRQMSQILTAIALGVSLLSCATSYPADTWWPKQGSYDQPAIARIVNQTERPLILSDRYWPRLFSLSYDLRPDAAIAFLPESPAPLNLPRDRPLFLYRPADALRDRLKAQGYGLRDRYRAPRRYPYLPPIDRHAALWLTELRPAAAKGS